MAYTGYEVTASDLLSSVQFHCRHLTTGGNFDGQSIPTKVQVEKWITETYYDLNAHLAAAGYAIPVTDTEAKGFLERLNVYGTVLQVELSHPITGRRGEENDRYKTYRDQYMEGLKIIETTDALSALGATKATSLSAFVEVGGRSHDRKQDLYTNTDAVQSRFIRDFGRDPRVTSGGLHRLDNDTR